MNRTRAHRTSGFTFFIGKVNGKAFGILIAHTCFGECLICPIAKARHVPSKHIVLAFAVYHPLCRHEAHASRLAKPRNNAVTTEIVFEVGMRPIEHIAIRRPYHRTVDHPLNPSRPHYRHTVNGAHHILFDPIKIIGKQFMGKV